LLNGDGTTSPFVIPTGQVFVVTAVELNGQSTITPGHRFELALFREANPLTLSTIVDATGVSDCKPHFFGTIPNGSVGKSGTQPCAYGQDKDTDGFGLQNAFVHGFFATDN